MAIPVVGAGLVIAGGAAQPVGGLKVLLKLKPLQLLGLISFSLYLWHWPILVVATQHRGVTTLPVWENVLLLSVATLVAMLTYWAIGKSGATRKTFDQTTLGKRRYRYLPHRVDPGCDDGRTPEVYGQTSVSWQQPPRVPPAIRCHRCRRKSSTI